MPALVCDHAHGGQAEHCDQSDSIPHIYTRYFYTYTEVGGVATKSATRYLCTIDTPPLTPVWICGSNTVTYCEA